MPYLIVCVAGTPRGMFRDIFGLASTPIIMLGSVCIVYIFALTGMPIIVLSAVVVCLEAR